MKILELALVAFGPFTDVVLDLSSGQEGLHLIYGPNEAGKSSALRALRQALFGIPAQSTDSFVHPYAKMRIGLTVRAGDGGALRFFRRKGNRGTLLAADGATPLAEEALGRFLNGLSEAEFKSRFALDHEDLVEGGKVILQGGGELGAVLFQAGGGLKNLLDVQRELNRELESLFKPGGSKPRINAGLAELRSKKETLRSTSLRSDDWLAHETASQQARARLAEIGRELEAKQAAKHRLERLQEALPLMLRRQGCEQELARLGDVPLLSDAFSTTRHEVLGRRESAITTRDRAREAIARLDGQIALQDVPDALLAESEAIEHLLEGLAADRKARKALPAEEQRLLQALSALRDLLAELWPDLLQEDSEARNDLISAGETLRLTRAQKAAIQNLAGEQTRLLGERQQTLKQLAELADQLCIERGLLDGLLAPIETGPLELALKQARDQGDLDSALEAARSRLAAAERQAARALAQLPHWTGTLEDLDRAQVPGGETIDRFEHEFAERDAERERLRAERWNATSEQSEAESILEQLRQAAGTVPTEDDLARARTDRDRLWGLIRRAWETGTLPEASELPNPAHDRPPSPGTLAGAFERLRDQADSHADRLRREAERVSQQAAALARLHRARQRLEFVEAEESRINRRSGDLQERWSTAWSRLEISPLLPREMRGWLQLHADLIKQAAEIHATRSEVKSLEGRVASHRQTLAQRLQEAGAPAGAADEPLASLRDRAEAGLRQLADVEAGRSKLVDSRIKLERRLEMARAQIRGIDELRESWRARWTEAIAPLRVSPEAAADQALETLNQTSELQAQIKAARESEARISAFQREGSQFTQELAALCRRVAPDLVPDVQPGSPSVELAAQELRRRFRAAEEARAHRGGLIRQRDAERANLERAEAMLEESDRQLATLCREAQCDAVDDLPVIEQRSRESRELRSRLREIDDQMQRLRGNEEEEPFRRAALALDPDRLPHQLQHLADEIAALDLERGELNRSLGREQQILEQMDGSSRAAEAAELAEELKARLGLDVEEYARLRLASTVLHEAIERYRQRTQGPILDRAALLFRQLTLGSFEGLKVSYDDQDQATLQAIRAGGAEMVGIEGLSEGTADQLYLALRLASLEVYLEGHEPIPLVVDDILIQFDDHRAAAALQVLADLSRRTQVVLFTHHEHLCRLAQSCVDPERLVIHRLPGQRQEARTSPN